MKEEEEVGNPKEEPRKPEELGGLLEEPPKSIAKVEKETELKRENIEQSEHSAVNIAPFEGLRTMRRNMERWAQNALRMQEQAEPYMKMISDIHRSIHTFDVSPYLKKFRDIRLIMEGQGEQINRITEQVRQVLKSVDWESIIQVSEILKEVTERDEKLQGYASSPHFWSNLKQVSVELINLPLNPADALLEELAKADMSIDAIKELSGTFTEEDLRQESQDKVHEDYMFQAYLLKLLDSYENHQEGYQLLIPSQFLILEGTLSEIFRIDEKVTAWGIKKRMHLLWDILYALYSHHPINISASLYNQISLTNIKGMFEELTKDSTKAVRINRNGVLHGRSHPDDWLQEDFHLLTRLLYTTLYMRRTIDVMLEDLMEWSAAELLEAIPLNEYRETLVDSIRKKVNKAKKRRAVSVKDIHQWMELEVSKELNKIVADEPTIRNLIMLMDIEEIAENSKLHTT